MRIRDRSRAGPLKFYDFVDFSGIKIPGLRKNRVAGGFSPPAPTAPRMRVRTGRFLRIGKGHRNKMTTSNAGYGTSRQDRFTRSGAVRPLRRARLSRCRRFGPSPCPTHYGERWATMPSADFCPITRDVAAVRAARVAVGSGGVSSPFGLALSPAPLATTAPRRVRWPVQPFRTGPQFDSQSGTDRLRDRSPRIRT